MNRPRFGNVAGLVLLVFLSTAFRASAVCPEFLGRTPGEARNIAVSDDHAYLGAGAVLQIFDVSDPSEPILVSEVPFRTMIWTLEVIDGYAYVALVTRHLGSRLCILDVSNPQTPVVAGVFVVPDIYDYFMGQLVVSGGYVYLHTYGGLLMIDVRDPTNPTEAGSTYIPDHMGFDVHEGLLYGVEHSTLYILDLSDPQNPTQLSYSNRLGFSNAVRITVSGSLAYVRANFADSMGWVAPGIGVIDISDPTDPARLGRWFLSDPDEHVSDIAISGTNVYVASQIDNYPDPKEQWLRVLDVSDPTRLTESGSCLFHESVGYASPRIEVLGSHVYAIAEGMRVVDCSDPSNPTKVSDHDDPLGWIWKVEVSNSHAYVAASTKGLGVVDVSDPLEPKEISLLDHPRATDVAVSGNYAYVVGSPSFAVIDIADPYSPVQVGSLSAGIMGIVDFSDGLAYTLGYYGLSIIDPSDASQPIEIGRYEYIGNESDLAVFGGYAYVVRDDGLHIVDVSDPTLPVGIAVFETGGQLGSIATDGGYVYFVGDGFRVIDVSEPSAPVEVASCDACTYSRAVVLSDGHAYVECESTYVINVRNPLSPFVVDSFGFEVNDVFIDDDLAYLATDSGLAIYSPTLCPYPMPNPHLPTSEVE